MQGAVTPVAVRRSGLSNPPSRYLLLRVKSVAVEILPHYATKDPAHPRLDQALAAIRFGHIAKLFVEFALPGGELLRDMDFDAQLEITAVIAAK